MRWSTFQAYSWEKKKVKRINSIYFYVLMTAKAKSYEYFTDQRYFIVINESQMHRKGKKDGRIRRRR